MDLTTFSVALYKLHDTTSGARPTMFCGSAFIVHGGVLVTCRHCFEDYPLAPDEWYGAIYEKVDKTGYAVARIEAISYDPTGVDLATGVTDITGSPLKLTVGLSGIGQDVGCIGYPGTYGRLRDGSTGPLQFDQQSRWLEGYVTQAFLYERPDGKKIRSWEMDMPAPRGVSGAPLLMLRATGNDPVFIGVVYGTHTIPSDRGSADAMASGQPFALAHFFDSLHNLRGDALGTQTLQEYLGGHGMLSNASPAF